MAGTPDYVRKRFAPILDKTLKNAVAYSIGKEFPRIGGDRILDLCAEMILEVVEQHLRPLATITHGQLLWMAVDINDPPRRYKRIARTNLIPVVLDIATPEDIHAIVDRKSAGR